jgi:hypothetical protein
MVRSSRVNISEISKQIEDSLLVFKEDGDVYKNYLNEIVDGKYVVDTVKELEASTAAEAVVAKATKEEALNKLTVTTTSGKVFYADSDSRIDLNDAIVIGTEEGLTETTWKLAEEVNGSKYVMVSMTELKEARSLAINAKANIIGV